MKIEIVNQLSPPGLAGMICKRINNRILVYGGSYFPENEPLKSSKVQTNRITVYDQNFKLLYEQEGEISPDKGIIIQEGDTLYYILGSMIYRITVEEKVKEECIGTFDFNIESGYGCLVDGKLFFGHQESYLYDLNTGDLAQKASFPVEARGQGLSAVYQNELYYLGGANQEAYLDGYRYNFERDQWTQIEFELPTSVLGASNIQLNESGLLILGGFNRDVYNQAVKDLQKPGYREEYFSKEKSFFQWEPTLRILQLDSGKVTTIGQDDRFALCGAGFVRADDGYYIVSGECSPGRRTAEILLIKE